MKRDHYTATISVMAKTQKKRDRLFEILTEALDEASLTATEEMGNDPCGARTWGMSVEIEQVPPP